MRVLITGGAGFVGSNLADRAINLGYDVTIFDNLSRRGAEKNLDWLQGKHGRNLRFIRGDIRDFNLLSEAVEGRNMVYHAAAQVAVTTSISDPRTDFEVNALGTLNVLEAVRRSKSQPGVIFTSTNKVYGNLEQLPLIEQKTRWVFLDDIEGVSEDHPLDFHSPYGCSKGAADQYVRDYARIYGIKTVVFRMSCIYGPRQFGTEDQGWVAYFLIANMKNCPLTIYGDGKQVRDILFVDDLIDAVFAATAKMDKVSGNVFNIGGGMPNSISVWYDFKPIMEDLFKRKLGCSFSDWRHGDQKIYVSDCGLARNLLDWTPKTDCREGIGKLFDWMQEHRDEIG